MTNINIQKAREWAEKYQRHHVIGPENELAAVEVIQSLPDRWIGVDEVREAINDQLSSHPHGTVGHLVMEDIACKLQTLLDPPLPTLADMTPEERKACQWMQADVSLQGETLRVVITRTVERYSSVEIIDPNGFQVSYDHELVTPLPDLPRLEWPGSHADTITAESVEDVQAGRVADFEPALPRPEDVPAGELWSVRYYGREWAGVRSDHAVEPWSVISMDGLDYRDVDDSEITLMFRLVPEIP